MSVLIMSLFGICSFVIGTMLICRPAYCIEIQRKFYLLINWKIEPVSMEKEIRNTRLMGVLLICVSAVTFLSVISAR